MEKAIVKFNGGNLALLCSGCSAIIKTGKDFTQEELDYVLEKGKNTLPAQYCNKCKENEYRTSS